MSDKTVIQIQHSLSTSQARELNTLVSVYSNASIADSWKYGGAPADIPIIEADLALAKAKLKRYIDKLVESGK